MTIFILIIKYERQFVAKYIMDIANKTIICWKENTMIYALWLPIIEIKCVESLLKHWKSFKSYEMY